MKTFLKYVAVAASGLIVLAGCAKEEITPKEPVAQTVELSFSGAKPALDGATRTEITGTVGEDASVIWSQSGEKIRMAYTVDDVFVNDPTAGKPKFFVSEDDKVSVASDGSTATFAISGDFSANPAEGKYEFYTLYPSVSCTSADLYTLNPKSISAKVGSIQTPSATSFDAKADVMLGKSKETYEGLPTEAVPVMWKRMVSHGMVTLKNLDDNTSWETGEKVKSVTFTAPTATKVSGSTYMDIVAQTVTTTTSAINSVTLSYGTGADLAASDGSFVAWFCSLPFTVAQDEKFKVEVLTTRGTYTREITAREGGIQFKENTLCTLGIDMTSATFAATIAIAAGNYVVLGKNGSSYYAMSSQISTTSTKYSIAETFTYDGTSTSVTTDNEALVWAIAGDGEGGYTISNGGKYLWYNGSGNTANLKPESTTYTIDAEDDGTYNIESEEEDYTGRQLRFNYNNGNIPRFAFYTSTNTTQPKVYLVPVSVAPGMGVSTQVVDVAHAGGAATVDVTGNVAWTAAVTEGSGYLTAGPTPASGTGAGTVTLTFAANTSTTASRQVKLTIATTNPEVATPSYEVIFTQAAAPAAGAPMYVKVTEDLSDWSGDYLIVYEATSIAMDGSAGNPGNKDAKISVDIVDNAIEASVANNASKFTIAAVSGGYSIQGASGKYIGRNAGGNGIDVSSSTVYVNTITFSGAPIITGAGGYILQYNTGGYFRYYASDKQKALALYKLDAE
jgi:hypothetical protein